MSDNSDDDAPAIMPDESEAVPPPLVAAPTLLGEAILRRDRINSLVRCETTAWSLGISVREPGTSFQVPHPVHRALTAAPRIAVRCARTCMCIFDRLR
jgi:hypothetical protein